MHERLKRYSFLNGLVVVFEERGTLTLGQDIDSSENWVV
jgi:hypothetical protein